MALKSILIVIPHYGPDARLRRLLSSLGISFPGENVFSHRHSVAPFLGGVVLIVNNNLENRGFTYACNEGIRYGLEKGFDAVWLLNNDTEVPGLEHVIRSFCEEFEHDPNTGVIGCKMLSMSDPDFIHHGGTRSAFPAGVHKHGRVSRGEYAKRSQENWVTGASMIISRTCFLKTGILDEHFFNYGSDSDFCFRAKIQGSDIVYLPVPILHAIGESQDPSPEQRDILARDMRYFEDKWVTGGLFQELNS